MNDKNSNFAVQSSLIRLLLIEDNPGDARLIKEYLSDIKNVKLTFHLADRLSTGLDILENEFIDIILLDLKLPDSQGLDSIQKIFSV